MSTVVNGYQRLQSGFWIKLADDTGPYALAADGVTFTLAAGGGGGGGGGDASAANQVAGNVLLGPVTETAPATDTASSGLNGRLQRIAQRLTSLVAIMPGLGTKTMAFSEAVTLATDDTQIGAKTTASVLSAGGSGIIGWLSDAVTQLKALVTNSPSLQTTLPRESSSFSYTMNAPQKTFRAGFESVVASGLDTAFFTTISTGSGMAASQSGGSALLTTGTTTFAESIYRSIQSFSASMTLRFSTQLSQRIANQEFYVELVDVIGDALAFTVNSATSITVTIPGNTFTAANVGQSMHIGALSLASCPAGKYAIASVSGNNVTFTVAAFPGSGSGTCSLFGWNFQHVLYSGVVAQIANYDAGRNGYFSSDTAAAINTTAAPGHVATVAIRDATGNFLDQLSASSTVLENTLRASRVRNVPEDPVNLFIQIRMVNLAVAPASTTTWTLGFLEVENFVSQQVSIVSVSPQGLNAALAVQVSNTPSIGTVTTLTGTTSLTPGVAATNLGKAEDAVAASGDTGLFMLGVRRDALLVSASGTGDYNEIATSQYGAVLEQTYEKSAKTYSATVNVAAAAAATDIATITGSASVTVFVTKVIISGIQTTAGLNDILLVKRSTADTGGTSTGGTALPHDSNDAAASATVLAYTANPTTGTLVANLRRNYQPIGGVTSVVNPVVVYDFGDKGRPLTLRGIAQVLAVNLNGATLTGGTFDITFEWFEI